MRIFRTIEEWGERWYGLIALLAVPTVIVFAPLLTGTAVNPWGDDVIQAGPYFTHFSRAIRAGDSFLIDPLNYAGYPVFATVFGFYAPWNYALAWLIGNPFAFATVAVWLTVAVFALGAFFTVAFLRELGVSFWPAYLAGVAFTISHQTQAFLPQVTNFHLLLPLLFYVLLKLDRGGSFRYVAAGAGAVAFGWLAVNFQEAFYTFLVGIGFAAFLVWQRYRAGRGGVRRFLGSCLLAYLIGTAIGLIQILPANLMAETSTRASGVPYAAAVEDPLLPTDILRYVIPGAKLPQGIPFGTRGASVPLYMGIVPLFFFLAAFGRRSAGSAVAGREALTHFFIWLFAAIVATSVIYSPIFWVMTKLPIFSYFRVPDRWMFIAVFSASLLAGIGAQRLLDALAVGASSSFRRGFLRFATVIGAVFLGLVLLNVMFAVFEPAAIAAAKNFFSEMLYSRYQPGGNVPVEHYFGIIDRVFGDLHQYFSFANPLLIGAAVSIVASLIGLGWVIRRGSDARRAGALLAIVTVANFLMVKSFDYRRIPAHTFDAAPSTIRFLQEHPGRTLPVLYEHFEEAVGRPRFGLGGPDGVIYRHAMLVPNTNLYYGVESAIIKDGLEPMAISRLMSLVGAPTIGIPREFPQSDPEAAARTLVERKALLDFLGIRYLVSGYAMDDRVFPKAFEGSVSSKRIPITIYENRDARPLVSFADRLEFVPGSEEGIFSRYREQNFSGLLADCREPCQPGIRSFGQGSVTILDRKNTRISVRTESQEPTFLVLSQNHLPGWRAFIDGVEAPRHTVNTVFLGLEVPAGEHDVAFVYSNPCGGIGFVQCLRSLLP